MVFINPESEGSVQTYVAEKVGLISMVYDITKVQLPYGSVI